MAEKQENLVQFRITLPASDISDTFIQHGTSAGKNACSISSTTDLYPETLEKNIFGFRRIKYAGAHGGLRNLYF